MKKGQQYLGTVSELAIKFGCYEQLMDGVTILDILAKRKTVKGLFDMYPSPDKMKVYVSPKMTTGGGYAYYDTGHISVNSALVDADHLKSEFCITLIHEYAHHVAYTLYREKGHGNAWRYVMETVFGLPANMYHSNVEDFAAHRAQRNEQEAESFFDELDL